MLPSCVKSEDLLEVVYLPEVENPKDPRFDKLDWRLKKLEDAKIKTSGTTTGDGLLKRNAFWVTPLVTLVLGSGAVATVAGLIIDHRIDAKLEKPLKQMENQDTLLAKMDGRLEGITGMLTIVVQNETRRLASLTPNEFQKALPAIDTVLTVAKNEKVPPTPAVPEIKSRLKQVEQSVPGFWGAAAAMVSYQSGQPGGSLPNCLDSVPSGTLGTAPDGILSHAVITDPATYRNCEIRLDDPRFPVVLTQYTLGGVLRLTNCHVVYDGGRITFPPGTGDPYRVELVACTYDFKVSTVPGNPAGKTLVAGLLASNDPKSATIDLPTS